MSDKDGSEERGRDPSTPDTLADRLAAERARRTQARDQSVSGIHLSTPMPAAPVSVDTNTSGPAVTTPAARKSLHLDYVPKFPPDSPQASGKAQIKPAKAAQWEGLMDTSHEEFMSYMMSLGVKDDLLTFMADIQMDGQHWRMAISNADSTSVREDIEDQIKSWAGGKSSAAVVMRITMDTKLAFEEWLSNKATKLIATDTKSTLSLKDLHSIKMPEPPKGDGLQGRISSEQLKSYVESLQATFNLIDREYSDRLSAILPPNSPKIAPEPRRRPRNLPGFRARGGKPSPFPPNGLFSNPADSESFFF